jgi:hypothetical protein
MNAAKYDPDTLTRKGLISNVHGSTYDELKERFMSFDMFYERLHNEGYSKEDIELFKRRLRALALASFLAVKDQFHVLKGAYLLYSVDIVVNSDLDVTSIEANSK